MYGFQSKQTLSKAEFKHRKCMGDPVVGVLVRRRSHQIKCEVVSDKVNYLQSKDKFYLRHPIVSGQCLPSVCLSPGHHSPRTQSAWSVVGARQSVSVSPSSDPIIT